MRVEHTVNTKDEDCFGCVRRNVWRTDDDVCKAIAVNIANDTN